MKECVICEAMREDRYPFARMDGVLYLDSEDQIEGGLIEVKYCLLCGKRVEKED